MPLGLKRKYQLTGNRNKKRGWERGSSQWGCVNNLYSLCHISQSIGAFFNVKIKPRFLKQKEKM